MLRFLEKLIMAPALGSSDGVTKDGRQCSWDKSEAKRRGMPVCGYDDKAPPVVKLKRQTICYATPTHMLKKK